MRRVRCALCEHEEDVEVVPERCAGCGAKGGVRVIRAPRSHATPVTNWTRPTIPQLARSLHDALATADG